VGDALSNQRSLPCEGSVIVCWRFLELAKLLQTAVFLRQRFSWRFRKFTQVTTRLLLLLKVLGTCDLSRISACGSLELPSTLGIRSRLGTEAPRLTRESQNTQSPGLRFRAMHATDGRWEVRFERAAAS